MSPLLAPAAILVALALAACGDDDDEPSAEPATTQTRQASGDTEAKGERPGDKLAQGDSQKQARPGTEIVATDSQYGSILFNGDEQAIYLFDKESSPTSECYGACAAAWPPVLTKGEPQAGSGVEGKLLGTTQRDDGATQVTYDGHPLYTYSADTAAGDTNGQGVGGVWWVVGPDGQKITETAGGGAGASTTTAGATGVPGY
jgi:predicted lipoprotein with Yx(FWY)xxD motif